MTLQASDLRKYNYFSSLSNDAIEALSKKMTVVNFPAAVEIVREGVVGDAFYFVKEGRLEVTKKTGSGQEAKISVIGGGHGFGETALLTCSVRTCSVRALTPAVLYRLLKADFDEVVLHEAAFRNMLLRKAGDFEHYNRIKTLRPFALLEPDKMYAVLSRMVEKTFAAGEDIICQGEKGDYYYIVKSGSVSVLQKKKGEQEPKQVAVLAEGDGFGEEALIRDDPRNATCRAIGETVVYALVNTDFNQVMKASFLENIFSEDIPMDKYLDKYVIIDARITSEYEEEHIRGSLNLPVEALRQQCLGLDPSKEYITYCTNDARGMVAAFLLKNRGFKARCLRGGISSWTGPVETNSDGVHMPRGHET
jgi:CRP-like cAMP-binding protein